MTTVMMILMMAACRNRHQLLNCWLLFFRAVELAEKSGTQPDVLNKTQLNLARLLRYYVYIFVLVLNQRFTLDRGGGGGGGGVGSSEDENSNDS